MASVNSASDIHNDELLADVAYWRVRGLSWEDTATKVQWEPTELRHVTRNDPDFERELGYAIREYEQEIEARALQSLQVQMAGADPRAALTAAKATLSYLTRKNVERTRLEVARLRAEEAPPSYARPARTQTPPAERGGRTGQEEEAAGLVREGVVVHLWGGRHELQGAIPDDTDMPLRLVFDETVPGRRVYWAVPNSSPTSTEARTPNTDAPPG